MSSTDGPALVNLPKCLSRRISCVQIDGNEQTSMSDCPITPGTEGRGCSEHPRLSVDPRQFTKLSGRLAEKLRRLVFRGLSIRIQLLVCIATQVFWEGHLIDEMVLALQAHVRSPRYNSFRQLLYGVSRSLTGVNSDSIQKYYTSIGCSNIPVSSFYLAHLGREGYTVVVGGMC